MNPSAKYLSLAAIAAIALSGCGKKEPAEPAVTHEEVKAAQAEAEKSSENKLAAGLNDLKASSEKALAENKAEIEAKMKAELETKLAEQKKALTQEFEASNKALRAQIDALTKQFETAKPALTESVASSIQSKLPALNTSVSSLEKLVSGFSPTSIEQIDAFKTKYQNELATAKKLYDEVVKLLANTKYGDMLPKF